MGFRSARSRIDAAYWWIPKQVPEVRRVARLLDKSYVSVWDCFAVRFMC